MSNQVLLKKSSVVAKVPTSGDLAYGEVALNYADGKLYFKNSSNTVQPLGIAYTKVIANTTAKINQGYICNTGAGSFTITLPASPETGHYVIISDDNAFGTNPLYVARNGNPIAGIAENLTIDITGASVTLLWDGGSWNVYSQVGATGGSGSGGTEYNFSSFPQGLIPDYDNTYTLGNSTYKWNYVNSYGYRFGDNTTQTTSSNADGSSITNSSGTITAQAGGLAGNTLNSGVVYSSLTTLGTQVQRINWSASGVAAPSFTSSSSGSKLILYPAIASNQADYAIGIDSATIWNSVPVSSSSFYFKWYGGTTNVATLDGTGALTLASTLAVNSPTISTTSSGTASVFNTNATTLNIGGAATTVSIGAGSGTTTVNNNLVVTGTFTVNGTTETINATTITVDDKNIELGSVASPTNITADGGGITLKGATDKTFNWVNATSSWTSSEHLDLASTKAYYIAGTSVLNATTLGSAVVTSSLTTVGTIGTGVWQGTLVAGQYGGTGVNNSGKTITLGGNLTTSGAFATTFTTTSTTSVTLPTSGTLATLAGTETFTNKTLTNPIIGTIVNTGTLTLPTSTDTLVGRATTDTLTNKTLTSPVISTITNTGTITIPTTTGTLALQGDTHYIGTTAVTLNRASANLALTGISSVTLPGSVSGTVQIIPTSAVGTGTVLTIPATTGTIVTTGDSATVTNTMLAGSIANAKLTNSSVTIGSTAVSLGSTVTTFAGLASVTSTTFVGALTGNASTATTLATTRAIYGNNFDGSAALTGIIASTYGGTGNGFTKFSGPTTAERTFTLPDASSTIVVQGGALGTPSSGTLTNATGLPVSGITSSTSTALGLGSIELGHATDTTLSRSSAGVLAVEGVVVPTVSSTSTLTNKTLTSPTINAGALSGTFSGDATLSGNINITGALTLPNRPAFRVVGNGGSITATTTVTSTNWTLDFQQGSALNTTTGIFTAPVAGLYQVNLVIRTNSNASGTITQAIVRKTAIADSSVTTQIMVEFAANTTMNHAGGSTITKMAVGDTLKFDVTVGTISFDGNDNWSVAFIG